MAKVHIDVENGHVLTKAVYNSSTRKGHITMWNINGENESELLIIDGAVVNKDVFGQSNQILRSKKSMKQKIVTDKEMVESVMGAARAVKAAKEASAAIKE